MAEVKHITMTCPVAGCLHKAFVQVVVDEDTDIQKKIDAKAATKLIKELERLHKGGNHD